MNIRTNEYMNFEWEVRGMKYEVRGTNHSTTTFFT